MPEKRKMDKKLLSAGLTKRQITSLRKTTPAKRKKMLLRIIKKGHKKAGFVGRKKSFTGATAELFIGKSLSDRLFGKGKKFDKHKKSRAPLAKKLGKFLSGKKASAASKKGPGRWVTHQGRKIFIKG